MKIYCENANVRGWIEASTVHTRGTGHSDKAEKDSKLHDDD